MKILVPVDGSDCSKATLQWAVKTLNKDTVKFYLLTVIADPMVAEYEVEDARAMLKESRSFLTDKGFKVIQANYIQGEPTQVICKTAEKENVDQVLIGSHGRSGLVKILLGSVSEAVLEHCQKPVFIYRNVTRNADIKADDRALSKTML